MLKVPEVPINSPAAWTGNEVPESEWMYELEAEQVKELIDATERVKGLGLPIEQVSMRNFQLPRLGPVLRDVARELEFGRGFALFRGFPVDQMSLDDIRLMYFGASTYMGVPISQNSRNQLLGDVKNEGKAYSGKVRAYQSNARLSYHNDSADTVGLLCVKPAKAGGVSKVVSAVTVQNTILAERPDLLEVLYREPFYFSWKGEGPADQLPYFWSRIFSWHEGRFDSRWVYAKLHHTQDDFPEVPRMSSIQLEAIEYAYEVSNRPDLCLDMHFRPGDVQYLNDPTVWHSRTAFEDFDDPAEHRHLLRVWLNRYRQATPAPDFSNRHDELGDSSANPRRRFFPVDVHDTW